MSSNLCKRAEGAVFFPPWVTDEGSSSNQKAPASESGRYPSRLRVNRWRAERVGGGLTGCGLLLELGVFGFGLLEDGDVGVGVFPEGEEVLVGGARFR
jgi:hypothetical protein